MHEWQRRNWAHSHVKGSAGRWAGTTWDLKTHTCFAHALSYCYSPKSLCGYQSNKYNFKDSCAAKVVSGVDYWVCLRLCVTHSVFNKQSATHKVIVVFAQADNQKTLLVLGGREEKEQKSRKFKGWISQNHSFFFFLAMCQKHQNSHRG